MQPSTQGMDPMPMQQMQPGPSMQPQHGLTCPGCGFSAQLSASPQTCSACRLTFALYAGPRADASVIPAPFNPHAERVKVTSNGVVLRKMGLVSPEGVSEGTLDPITGYIPMDQSGVYFGDIWSIAVWRKVDVIRIVVAAIIPLPLSLLFLGLCFSASPGFLILELPFVAITAWMFYRAFAIKQHLVRVVGGARTIEVRFDAPIWRRKKFHDELLRRAGISPRQIP
jgi:hypothetical protein